MTEDLLSRIQERMPEFSKSQKLIADFILNHYEKAAYMTALKLGNSVKVSESTVVRFAIELGFDGYPELQRSLQNHIKNKLTTLQRMEVANNRIGEQDILTNILQQDIDRIRHTMDETSPVDFDRAVESILKAKRIYILGAMSSSILARFLDYYFQLVFSNVCFVQAVGTSGIYQQIIHMNEDDCFITISFPRYSQSTLSATKYAHECGANVIAITDSSSSPLAQYANELLLARSDMVSFADSLVAPLSVINALIVAIGYKRKDKLEVTFEKLEQLWEQGEVYKKDV